MTSPSTATRRPEKRPTSARSESSSMAGVDMRAARYTGLWGWSTTTPAWRLRADDRSVAALTRGASGAYGPIHERSAGTLDRPRQRPGARAIGRCLARVAIRQFAGPRPPRALDRRSVVRRRDAVHRPGRRRAGGIRVRLSTAGFRTPVGDAAHRGDQAIPPAGNRHATVRGAAREPRRPHA